MILKRDKYLQSSIIFVTAAEEENIRTNAICSGGDNIVHKPFDPDFLVNSARTHSERSRAIHRFVSRVKENEERFRLLSKSAKDAIFAINELGLIKMVP